MLSHNGSCTNNGDNNNNNNGDDNGKEKGRLIVASEEVAMVGGQEDILLVIFSFITAPDLLWMELVCHRWSIYLIDVAIGNELPLSRRIPFENNSELREVSPNYLLIH